eukprot:jgi/Ulvmu1/7704/UM039_0010.1
MVSAAAAAVLTRCRWSRCKPAPCIWGWAGHVWPLHTTAAAAASQAPATSVPPTSNAGSPAAAPPGKVHLFVDSSKVFHGAVAARPTSRSNETDGQEPGTGLQPPHWRMCLAVDEGEAVGARPDAVGTQSRELIGTARAVREYLRSHAAKELRGAILVVHNDNDRAVEQLGRILRPPGALVDGPAQRAPGDCRAAGGASAASLDAGLRRLDLRRLRQHNAKVSNVVNSLRGNLKRMADAGERACARHRAAAEAAAAAAAALQQAREDVRQVVATGVAAQDTAAQIAAHGRAHAEVTADVHAELAGRFADAAATMAQATATADEVAQALEGMAAASAAAQADARKAAAAAMQVTTAGRVGHELRRAVAYGVAVARQGYEGGGDGGRAQGWDAAVAKMEGTWRAACAAGVDVVAEWLPRRGGLMPEADRLTRPWDGDDWAVSGAALASSIRDGLRQAEGGVQGNNVAKQSEPVKESMTARARRVAAATLARLTAAWGWAVAKGATPAGAGGGGSAAQAADAGGDLVFLPEGSRAVLSLEHAVWPPDVDLFASAGTSKAPLYYAAAWDGSCVGVDAFAQGDWAKWPSGPAAVAAGVRPPAPARPPVCYAFPPMELLPATLEKVRRDRVTAWLVVPSQLPKAVKAKLAALPVHVSFPLGGRLRSTVRPAARNSVSGKEDRNRWREPLRVCFIAGCRSSTAARPK